MGLLFAFVHTGALLHVGTLDFRDSNYLYYSSHESIKTFMYSEYDAFGVNGMPSATASTSHPLRTQEKG